MVALLTSNSIQAMLHEYYRGPVAEQLNQEVLAVELFEKGSFTWAGKNVIIPLHTGRNTGVGYRAENTNLPTATAQVHSRIVSNATFLYGRFEVTGPTMASAEKGGMNSFIGALDNEMTRLVDDLKDHANLNMFVGGPVRGLINQKQAQVAKANGATQYGAPGQQVANSNGLAWQYDGDFSFIDGTWRDATGTLRPAVDPNDIQTWCRIDIIQLDTYEVVPLLAALGAGAGIFITDFSKSNRTITIQGVGSGGAVVPFTTAGGAVDAGVGCAIKINDQQLTNGVGNFGIPGPNTDHEPAGILTNLFDGSLFNLPRNNGAADGGEELQSTCATAVVTGANDRAALVNDRLQAMLDTIDEECGKVPDLFLIHNTTRQTYISGTLSNQTIQQTAPATKATGVDYGYNDDMIGYGGIKMRRSRHCPKGMFIALKLDSWKLAELKAGDFADLDGAILSRVDQRDSWEGFWRWYYQLVCCYPNANGVLFGFNL
ncbi:MAG: hypothetical protein Unbinned400contig1002_33 [Prokaryotic dsDNA virus sp.]|nr:MAG: hypothetical protein Unbinned400contig1002_33 [Prokaryotic dsDNA virus sp.]|tara:strand:+ start:3203 stop:4663 length:1461 start_codon:yes stop_codon:yes gene_type:complete